MISCRNGLGVLAAALGAAWLIAADPVQAGGAKSEAKEECRDVLADKGYDDVDIDKTKKRAGGDKVVVRGEAEQGGDSESVKCVYNTEQDKARVKN
jgi:hypothetical protein